MKLSKAGYGTVEQILEMSTDLVIAAIEYEKFIIDYEAIFIEINREKER